MIRVALTALMLTGLLTPARADEPKPLKLLFSATTGITRPNERFRQLQPVLAKRGIAVEYTDKADALNPATLAKYDGLILYANIDEITPKQESALLDYVAYGKGFIPLHCASYCFRNSSKVVDLIGAQFLRHGTGTFRTTIAQTEHPLMKGFKGFESWDELTFTPSTTRRIARFWNIATRAGRRSRGRGCGRTARAACFTPPGATTTAPGATSGSRTWSSAASAGRAERTPASSRCSRAAGDDETADGCEAV